MVVRRQWRDPSAAELAAFWDQPRARAVLHTRSVTEVYRLLQQQGISQRTIARLAGQAQSEISEILKGRRVRDITVLSRITDGLHIPREAFGLATSDSTEAAHGAADDRILEPITQPDAQAEPRCVACDGPVSEIPPAAPAATFTDDGELVGPCVWTGVEVWMWRMSCRMTTREFAPHLGISDRMLSKWEAGGAAIRPRPANQRLLDTSLAQGTPEQRARFAVWLTHATSPTPANSTTSAGLNVSS